VKKTQNQLKAYFDNYRHDEKMTLSLPTSLIQDLNRQNWPKTINTSILIGNSGASGGDSPTFGRSRQSSNVSESNTLNNTMNMSRREIAPIVSAPFVDNSMTQCIVYLDNEDNSV
jgi:hypothetical protein